jgi:hypothetical protein
MKVSYCETGRCQALADTSSTPALSTGCLLDALKRVAGRSRSMTLGFSQ